MSELFYREIQAGEHLPIFNKLFTKEGLECIDYNKQLYHITDHNSSKSYEIWSKGVFLTDRQCISHRISSCRQRYYRFSKNSSLKEIMSHLMDSDGKFPSHCSLTGERLVYKRVAFPDRNSPLDKFSPRFLFSPSIDRIDNSLGYEVGNIQIISWLANRFKSDCGLEKFKEIINHIASNKDSIFRKLEQKGTLNKFINE